MRVILGSQSPRRREILSYFSLPFEQHSPHFAEERVPFNGDPILYASTLSEGKGASLTSQFPRAVILTADTVVFKEGKIYNKPANEEENLAMLKELIGSWHSVFTAVTASLGKRQVTRVEETRVEFQSLGVEKLKLYHKYFKGCDKAGGYSIQMGGSLIVKRMEGCFYNAMGLPLQALQAVLKEVGIDLWHFLVSS
jgi:septum formation protein